MADGNISTSSALGLSLIGTTCCALPAVLVALGAGGAVASLVSSAPWLIALSEFKGVTFGATSLVLGWAWWRAARVDACDVADAARLRTQRWLLRVSTGLLVVSVFAAYALLPLTTWLSER